MINYKHIIKELNNVLKSQFSEVNAISEPFNGLLFKIDEDNITELSLDLSKLELNTIESTKIGELVLKLENLKKIFFRKTKGDTIPNWLFELKHLETLSLRENNLRFIPEDISGFKMLKFLDLAYNDISILPNWLVELPNLQDLNLERNYNLEWNQTNLKVLEKLKEKGVGIKATRLFNFYLKSDLPNDQLEVIKELEKENIEKERNKQYVNPINVNIVENKVVGWKMMGYTFNSLPNDFGIFKDLKSLTITNTHLETLPKSFGQLGSLEILDLSHNHLKELPDSFGNLKTLRSLDLSNNNFNEIPIQIWDFDLLTDLNLSNNLLSDEEKAVIQKPLDNIRDYLRKKATITIFISHAVIDFDKYQVRKLADYLKNQKEISEVYFCEEDLAGNIDNWMLDTVQKSHLLLFIATKKSVFESADCKNELQLADKFSIPVIPLKGIDVEWKDLAKLNLSRELGIEFTIDSFDSFCNALYNYILNFKREIDLMSEKTRKQGIINIYERFKLILDESIGQLQHKIQELEARIKKLEE